MSKPIAVLISDIHYSLKTLEVADAATRQSVTKANELQVPLIVAGDTHDTKANLRAECMNAMIETFAMADSQPWILIGNHDKINEKGIENALYFLSGLGVILDKPQFHHTLNINFIPYQHDPEVFKTLLAHNCINIVHQGLVGANSGEYIQDKSAVNIKDMAGYRVISGHYHNRQTLKLSNNGQWDYIGNPYTLNFAEANDLKKGYQILFEDGSLKFVPTNLRKHVVYTGLGDVQIHTDKDLIRVKIEDKKEILNKVTKEYAAKILNIKQPFKLDKIETIAKSDTKRRKSQTLAEQLDELINEIDATDTRKETLKNLWKTL